MKLSNKQQLILALLQNFGESFGQDLVRRSGRKLGRATVYTTLSILEEKRMVFSHPEPRIFASLQLPRRLYSITLFGHETFEKILYENNQRVLRAGPKGIFSLIDENDLYWVRLKRSFWKKTLVSKQVWISVGPQMGPEPEH